jgi:hypothetical protein
MSSIGKYIGSNKEAGSGFASFVLQAETAIYLNGLATSLSNNETLNINSFVLALKTGLNISALSEYFDTIQLLNAETNEISLRNLVKRAHDYQAVGAPVFTQFSGWKSTGTGKYLKTNYNPFSDAVRYSRDSAHLALYSNTDVAETASSYGGLPASGSGVLFALRLDGANANDSMLRLNQSASSTYQDLMTNSVGFFSMVRDSATSLKFYKDSTLLTSFTSNSTAIESMEMFALTRNSPTGALYFGVRELGLITTGKALTPAELNVIKTAYDTYKARLFFLTDNSSSVYTNNNGEIFYA